MSDVDKHKEKALEFLLGANSEIGSPVNEVLIEKIYDLFSENINDSVNFERKLTKLIEDES